MIRLWLVPNGCPSVSQSALNRLVRWRIVAVTGAGACEIPCHTRNAVAASSAFTCADLVLGGYVNPIPLDETIDASYEVGRALPSELRCTARGGCAVTPSALRMKRLR